MAGALWFNSLAPLAAAGHMLTDVAALAIALAAMKPGQRPADDRRAFGYRRLEVLAAAFNALLLFAVAIYILVEAVERVRAPQQVATLGVLADGADAETVRRDVTIRTEPEPCAQAAHA